MSIETLKNQNEDLIQNDLEELKYEIDGNVEGNEDEEVSDSIIASSIYQKFLEDIVEIKMSNNPKERKEKIKKIEECFTKDGIILYKDQTGGVKEIKDIKGFLDKVAKGEIAINFSIKYVEEGAITLDKKSKKGFDEIKIKKIQLNADYLE